MTSPNEREKEYQGDAADTHVLPSYVRNKHHHPHRELCSGIVIERLDLLAQAEFGQHLSVCGCSDEQHDLQKTPVVKTASKSNAVWGTRATGISDVQRCQL